MESALEYHLIDAHFYDHPHLSRNYLQLTNTVSTIPPKFLRHPMWYRFSNEMFTVWMWVSHVHQLLILFDHRIGWHLMVESPFKEIGLDKSHPFLFVPFAVANHSIHPSIHSFSSLSNSFSPPISINLLSIKSESNHRIALNQSTISQSHSS